MEHQRVQNLHANWKHPLERGILIWVKPSIDQEASRTFYPNSWIEEREPWIYDFEEMRGTKNGMNA
jgi:hypothetical protein